MLESEIADLQLLADDWQKTNQNIHIHFLPFKTTDIIEEIYTSDLKTNSPSSYDLVYMDVIWLSKFAEAGWLRELDQLFTPAELEPFVAEEIERGRYQRDKRLYRIPFRPDVGVILYNTDFVDKNDPPKTFDKLLKLSEDFKKQNSTYWGYLWQAGKYEGLVTTFFEVLSANGGFWIHPDPNTGQDEVGLYSPQAIDAIKFLRSTIDKKVSPPYNEAYQEDTYLTKFKKGEAAFLRSWPDSWAKINNADDSKIKRKVELTQIFDVANNSVGCLGGWGFGISKNARHPEAALRAIKFFTSKEVQYKFVMESGYLPSRKELFDNHDIQNKYPHFKNMLQLVQNARSRPQTPDYDRLSNILQCHLSVALSSNSDLNKIIATMKIAAEQTRELLNNNRMDQPNCDNL